MAEEVGNLLLMAVEVEKDAIFSKNYAPSDIRIRSLKDSIPKHEHQWNNQFIQLRMIDITQVIQVSWSRPKHGWIKVNMDGIAKGSMGYTGTACVMRDHEEEWIKGSGRDLGICSPLQAELWARWLGLQLA